MKFPSNWSGSLRDGYFDRHSSAPVLLRDQLVSQSWELKMQSSGKIVFMAGVYRL